MSRDCCCGCGGAPATAGGLAAREVGGAARGLRGVSRSSAGAGATGAGEGVAAPTPPTADAVCSPLCGGSAPLQCRRALACGPRLPCGSGSWLAFGVAGEVFFVPARPAVGTRLRRRPESSAGQYLEGRPTGVGGPEPRIGEGDPGGRSSLGSSTPSTSVSASRGDLQSPSFREDLRATSRYVVGPPRSRAVRRRRPSRVSWGRLRRL